MHACTVHQGDSDNNENRSIESVDCCSVAMANKMPSLSTSPNRRGNSNFVATSRLRKVCSQIAMLSRATIHHPAAPKTF
jgi:hypothetical protein